MALSDSAAELRLRDLSRTFRTRAVGSTARVSPLRDGLFRQVDVAATYQDRIRWGRAQVGILSSYMVFGLPKK